MQAKMAEITSENEQLNVDYANLNTKTNYLDKLLTEKKQKIDELQVLKVDNMQEERDRYVEDFNIDQETKAAIEKEVIDEKNKNALITSELENVKKSFSKMQTENAQLLLLTEHLNVELETRKLETQRLHYRLLEYEEISKGIFDVEKYTEQVMSNIKKQTNYYEKKLEEFREQNLKQTEESFKQINELKTNFRDEKQQKENEINQLKQTSKSIN